MEPDGIALPAPVDASGPIPGSPANSTGTDPNHSSEPPMTPVDVYMTGGEGPTLGCGYVWSADDAFRIRNEFRLLGDFVGSLAKHASQNQYLSLPLVLSYDEVLFGFEQGFLRPLSDSPEHDYMPPKSPQNAAAASSAFYAARETEFDRHAAEVVKTQEQERVRHLARTGTLPREPAPSKKQRRAAKKRKRAGDGSEDEAAQEVATEAASGAAGDAAAGSGRPVKMRKVEGRRGILFKVSTAIRSALHVVLPGVFRNPHAAIAAAARAEAAVAAAASAQARDVARRARAYAQARLTASTVTPTEARAGERARPTLALAIPAPRGVAEGRLRMRGCVFRDLYAKGYYMSCGAKFGSDFLAYAGEPLLFHAALAVVVVGAEEVVTPADVVALGRLGDATKKRTVMAFVDGDPLGEYVVRYVGVQWEETLP